MLAYRHAFHAGNHADVLKHIVLMQVLLYMNQKDKPYWVIDTHAGAGLYSLESGYANTKTEYLDGVGKLWDQVDQADLPEAVRLYLDLIANCNQEGAKTFYPGSPEIIHRLIRSDDRLRAFELHPTDYQILDQHFSRSRQVKTFHGDGFLGLKSVLPPPTRRALIFIDPPYEMKSDYPKLVDAMRDAMKRFAEGVYCVWYPIISRADHLRMIESLTKLSDKTLNLTMEVQLPKDDGFGMQGSGLFLINPPWNLAQTMAPTMSYLVGKLGQHAHASFSIT